jgi:hypothetical protein
MIKRLHSNAVWPRGYGLVFLAVIYASLDGAIWLIRHAFPSGVTTSDVQVFENLRCGVLAGMAGLYAIYRLVRFHPACNQGYGMWLKLTPWTAEKPLPLGPVHVVWQDVAMLTLMIAIGWFDGHASPLWVAVAFGSIYLLGLTILLAVTRTWGFCLLLCFLWPALMLPSVRGVPMFVVVGVMFNVAWLGHERSLRSFPWKFLAVTNRPAVTSGLTGVQIELRIPGLTDMASNTMRGSVGWPLIRLGPKLDYYSVSTRAGLLWSLLMGWWTSCFSSGLQTPSFAGFVIAFAVFGALTRFVIYCTPVTPPFSFPARIVSGRLILPGFDRVFVTPMVCVIAGILGAALIRHSGSFYVVVESCVVGLLWLILLNGKPTVKNWLLTGYHRYSVPRIPRGARQAFRPI